MPSRYAVVLFAASGLLTVFSSGCASDRIDLVKTGVLRAEVTAYEKVLTDEPEVWVQDGQLTVKGAVRRAPYARNIGAGHTHVLVQGPDGKELGRQWSAWMPEWIPIQYPRRSYYTVRFPWVPSAESTIKVWVHGEDHSPKNEPQGSIGSATE